MIDYESEIAKLSYQLYQLNKELVRIESRLDTLYQDRLYLLGKIEEAERLWEEYETTKENFKNKLKEEEEQCPIKQETETSQL